MSQALKFYNSLQRLPLGKRVFSFLVCRKARYFGTIRPYFETLEPGRCVVSMKLRKSVTNHLNTVHAGAMCNLVELVGGICVDISVPDGVRWIPKGMTVEYIALAKSSLKGVCIIDTDKLKEWDLSKVFPSIVTLYDVDGKVVMRGTIDIHLSGKKSLA